MDAIAAQPDEEPLDDWLGDISDDDWNEKPTAGAERQRATPPHEELLGPEEDSRAPTADRRPAPASHRATIERRRLVAVLALVVVLALAAVSAVLLLRSGDQATVEPLPEATSTTSTPTETSPSSTPTPPSPPPPATTPSTTGQSSFTLPEGTKLQRDTGELVVVTDLEAITDPEVVTELQQALSSAGYDPGPADGTFGPRTEAAVIAFQQANGLTADGIVGPETASALNGVLAGG